MELVRVTVNMTPDAKAAFEKMQAFHGYRSLSEYFVNLGRFDVMMRSRHVFSAGWAAMSGAQRDDLDQELRTFAETGRKVRRSFLRQMVVEALIVIADRMGLKLAPAVDVDSVVAEMGQRHMDAKRLAAAGD